MDSNLWKINGTSAAELGLRDFQLVLNNQIADQLSFNADGQAFDSAPIFAYGESLSLYKGSVRWFEGIVLSGPRFGSPNSERHDYQVAGLWWYLENLVFQQEWRAGTGTLNKSHVILGRDIDNLPVTAGEVITEALDYAIGLGAPFTYLPAELALLSAKPPPDEQVDLACAEVVRKMIRWIPDTVAWFDYSAATPVLHFTRRAAATAVQYDCTAGAPAEQIDIRDRSDLRRTGGVIINYERTDDIDGEQIPTLQQDIYSPGATPGFNTASLTINIPGLSLYTQSVDVVVGDIGNYGDKSWWQDRIPSLAGLAELELTSSSGSIEAGEYPYVLVSGPVPEWSGKTTVQGKFEAEFSWKEPNGTEPIEQKFSLELTLTDAETHKYTKEISYTPPNPYPTVAQRLYEAISVLHWQGSFQTVESECTAGPTPGKVLNLTGGLAAWAYMRAVIQSVSFDIDAGRTAIAFGPPEHLGPQDYIALLNANRTRITLYSGDSRKTGTSGDSDLNTGGGTPNSYASGGGFPRVKKLVIDDDKDPPKTITLDPSTIEKGKYLGVNEDGTGVELVYLKWR